MLKVWAEAICSCSKCFELRSAGTRQLPGSSCLSLRFGLTTSFPEKTRKQESRLYHVGDSRMACRSLTSPVRASSMTIARAADWYSALNRSSDSDSPRRATTAAL